MKKKMYSLQSFFRSFFPKMICPQYLLFKNLKTDHFEIVGRSGVVLCTIPPIPGKCENVQLKLAREVLSSFEEGGFGLDLPVSAELCLWDQCQIYDLEDCYYSYDDDFCKIIHFYDPDYFI